MTDDKKTNDRSFPFECGFSTRLTNCLWIADVTSEDVFAMYHHGSLQKWLLSQPNCGRRTLGELISWCENAVGKSKSDHDAEPVSVGGGVLLEGSFWQGIKKNAFAEAMKEAAQEFIQNGGFDFTDERAEKVAYQAIDDLLKKRVETLVNVLSDRIQRQVMMNFGNMLDKAISDRISAVLDEAQARCK